MHGWISADSREELIEAVVQHVLSVHCYEDTPESRTQIRESMKEGHPAP